MGEPIEPTKPSEGQPSQNPSRNATNGGRPKPPAAKRSGPIGIPAGAVQVTSLRNVFAPVYWLCVLVIPLAWLFVGFRVVANYGSRIEAINQVGLITIILCLVLWLGDAVGYLKLTRGLAAAIWTAFISSALITGAVVVKATFLSGDHVKIEDVVLLDETKVTWEPKPNSAELQPVLTDLVKKQNTFYRPKTPKDFFAPLAIVLTGPVPASTGRYAIGGNLSLANDVTGLSDAYGPIPLATTETPWRERALTKRLVADGALPGKLDEVAHGPAGRIVLIHSVRDVRGGLWNSIAGDVLKEGSYKLTVDIYDNVNRTRDQRVIPFVVKYE